MTAHGIDDRSIFRDDVDRQDFCIRLHRVVQCEQWHVYAACLMNTHYHLLFEPRLGRVSEGMKLLNGGYSRAFNRRHRRRGALFESRYSDRTIRNEEHLFKTVAYIEQNPVAAGMVASLADWIWTTGTPGSPLCQMLPPRDRTAPAARPVSDTATRRI